MLARIALRLTSAVLLVTAATFSLTWNQDGHARLLDRCWQLGASLWNGAADDAQVAGIEPIDAELSGEYQMLVQEPSQRRSMRPQMGSPMQNANHRSSYFMLRAFRDAIGDSWKSTVELFVAEQRVALGAVVDQEGWVVSKASQMPNDGKVNCRLYDGTDVPGTVVARNDELDLALLHIDGINLTAITWAEGGLPQRGKWVATTDTQSTPSAVGVVSAGLQTIDKKRTILGVELVRTEEGGALVKRVLRGTGADLAGLKVGDRISAIDGFKLPDHQTALEKLGACSAGQCVMLAVARGESSFETTAQLMDLASEFHDATEMEVNGLISARSSGFKNVFLHDTVLHPNQCGGPLVDLDGHVVGINIARAGRVTSYALPANIVRPEIERLIASSKSKLAIPAGKNATAVSAPALR